MKQVDPAIFTKSGLMVGLGETKAEILQVMDDLRAADVDFLTVGQYLQPTVKHHAIDRFVTPNEFESYKKQLMGKGFLWFLHRRLQDPLITPIATLRSCNVHVRPG